MWVVQLLEDCDFSFELIDTLDNFLFRDGFAGSFLFGGPVDALGD